MYFLSSSNHFCRFYISELFFFFCLKTLLKASQWSSKITKSLHFHFKKYQMLPDSPHKSRHPALPDLKVHKLLRQVKSIVMRSITDFSKIEHLCLKAKTPANPGSRPCRFSSYGCENKNALREHKILSSRPR